MRSAELSFHYIITQRRQRVGSFARLTYPEESYFESALPCWIRSFVGREGARHDRRLITDCW
jgi:hypothetical protein